MKRIGFTMEKDTFSGKRIKVDVFQTNDGEPDPEHDTVDAVRQRILPCMQYCAGEYAGPKNEHIRALGEYAPQSSYTEMTTLSQIIANETKRPFFLEPHKTFFTRDTTTAWVKSLSGKLPWWRIADGDVVRKKLEGCGQLNEALKRDGDIGGLFCHTWGNSIKPTELGTYIDKQFGHVIMRQAAGLYGLEECASAGPGRRQSPSMPWFAATPDGVTCLNEAAHEEYVEMVYKEGKAPPIGRDAYTDRLIKLGAPILTHEFKSLQKEATATSDGSRISSVAIGELYRLYKSGDIEGTKQACSELIIRKLELGNWMPSNREHDAKNSTKLADKARGSKIPSFFRRCTLLYPSAELARYKTERVTGKVYPHLLAPNESVLFDEFRRRPGRATVSVYDVASGKPNRRLFQIFYDEAPVVLSPKSTYYCQMAVQAIATLEYNESQRFIFSCVFSGERDNERQQVKLAIVYSYDTGIDRWIRDMFVARTLRCLGDASTWFDSFFTREQVYTIQMDHPYYTPAKVQYDHIAAKGTNVATLVANNESMFDFEDGTENEETEEHDIEQKIVKLQ